MPSFLMTYKLIKSQYQQNQIGWQKSFLEGLSQDEQGSALPWMTYPFIEFITKTLQPNHRIFEFGSGSSTLFFAKKVEKVIALESDKKWHEIMRRKLSEANVKNVELILMEDALENSEYENFVKNHTKQKTEDSIKNLSEQEASDSFIGDLASQKFDFIIIDSLKRFACAQNSIAALKPDGAIILDDSERPNYKKIFDFFDNRGFKKQDFFGIAPGQFKLKNTTIFWQT